MPLLNVQGGSFQLPRRLFVHLLVLDAFSLVGFLLYSNTSDIPFYLDDGDVVGEASYYNLPTLLSRAWTFGRWLVELTLAYNDYLRSLVPFFSMYRLTNIALHVATAFEVYLVALLLVRVTRKGSSDKQHTFVAILTGLFFLLHPLQTSTVDYLAQRYVLMATLFLFAAFLCYLMGRIRKGERLRSCFFFVSSAVFLVFGFFCKQFVLVFPVLVFFSEWFVLQRDSLQLKKALLGTLAMVLLALVYLNFWAGQNLWSLVFEQAPHPPLVYALTESWVVLKYLLMLLVPFNLALNHHLVPIEGVLEPRFLFSFPLHIVLVGGALALWRRFPLASFSVIWYYALLSESSSIVPRIDFIYDYRTYPSNFAFFLILALVLDFLYERRKRFTLFSVAGLSVLYGILTYGQNQLWRSKIAFLQIEVTLYPDNAKSWNLLGREWYLARDYGQSRRCFERSLEALRHVNPRFFPVLSALNYLYLGLIDNAEGSYSEAVRNIQRAVIFLQQVEGKSFDSRFWLWLAEAYHDAGNLRMTEVVLNRILPQATGDWRVWKTYRNWAEKTGEGAVPVSIIDAWLQSAAQYQLMIDPELEKGVRIVCVGYFATGASLFVLLHYLALRSALLELGNFGRQPAISGRRRRQKRE